jgi:hypothetical protein
MDTNDNELILARQRRDQAIACAFLAFTLALALVISNFGPDQGTADALKEIRRHKKILDQNLSVLHNNEGALAQELLALKNLQQH